MILFWRCALIEPCARVGIEVEGRLARAARVGTTTGRYAAIVTLGAVIRGGTLHFEIVCAALTDGVREVIRDTNVPIAFGVLTTDTVEQAIERAGGADGNKGGEVALAAIEMAHLRESLSLGSEEKGR